MSSVRDPLGLFCALLLLCCVQEGCGAISYATAGNVTVPVMVGPVLRIHGGPEVIAGAGKSVEVTAETAHGFVAMPYVAANFSNFEGANKFDVRIIKAQSDPTRLVTVDRIEVGSYSTFALVYFRSEAWTGLHAVIHESNRLPQAVPAAPATSSSDAPAAIQTAGQTP